MRKSAVVELLTLFNDCVPAITWELINDELEFNILLLGLNDEESAEAIKEEDLPYLRSAYKELLQLHPYALEDYLGWLYMAKKYKLNISRRLFADDFKEDFYYGLINLFVNPWVRPNIDYPIFKITNEDFVYEVATIFEPIVHDYNEYDFMWYLQTSDTGETSLRLSAQCSDFFYLATADAERITPDNIHLLYQARNTLEALNSEDDETDYLQKLLPQYFSALVRKISPSKGALLRRFSKYQRGEQIVRLFESIVEDN